MPIKILILQINKKWLKFLNSVNDKSKKIPKPKQEILETNKHKFLSIH